MRMVEARSLRILLFLVPVLWLPAAQGGYAHAQDSSLTLSTLVPTGPENVNFERLTGLSHNTVFTIFQGHLGFLWIGTADGLHRYDGYSFTVYRHHPSDSTSLVDNTVQALAEDPSGGLWVGTARGLDRWDRSARRFEHFDLRSSTGEGPLNIADLAVDSSGHLWMTTYGPAGLYRYNRHTETIRRYLSDYWIQSTEGLQVDTTGTLWVVTGSRGRASGEREVHWYNPRRDDFQRARVIESGAVHAGSSGTLWVGGDQSATIDPGLAPVQRIRAGLPPNTARNVVHQAQDGTLWIGTDRGIYQTSPSTTAVTRHAIDSTGTAGLSNYVWDLYEDRAGILWVGTRSGLYRYDPHHKPFAHLGPSTGALRESGHSAVMALQTAASGGLWAGTLGGGLVRLLRTKDRIESVEAPSPLPSDEVWTLHRDQAGRLWVGTTGGPCVLDPTDRSCTVPRAWTQNAASGPVYTVAESPDGTFWMGGTQLYRLGPKGREIDAPVPLEYGLDYTTIQALHVDDEGRLWVGMEGGGLVRYTPSTRELIRYTKDAGAQEKNRYPFPANTVWTIHEGSDGCLWMGTGLGLVRLDPRTGAQEHMYDADQLPGSIVYSILEDDRGRLWLGTNQGLVRFSPDTRQFRRYGTRDGLVNREFNRRAALRGQDGQLFFGGLRGVTAFDPDAIRENPYVPPVVITRMTKENRSSPVPINPYGRDQVALDYRDRVFTVGFAALNFTSPENNRYRYQLDGFEDDWVEAGTRRVVRYTNVPPGAYVFRVQGSNNDGIWNKEGASIRVSIDPPFWRTGWFQFLIGVLIAGVLVAMYRVRVRHLLRIERLRLRIARDLHDDVASQLASVAIRSDLLRVTAELTADERAELRQMGSLVRQTTETLRDIVWFVDPEHDRPGALVEKMKTTASRLLGGLEYRFDASAPDEHDCLRALDVRGRRNLFLIYKEALHNIARHAAAKTVQVTVRCPPETLELTICDDGTGFIPEDQSTWGTGMKSMRRRAEQIGADLKISSEPDRGTTLCLRVPAP